MSDGSTQEIKDKISVVELVSEYVELKSAGTNHKGLCPFHNEKTPSFMASNDKQIWHCFGCGEGGDIFSFIEKIEGVDFKEALQILAKRAGVTVARQDPKVQSQKNKLLSLLALTTKFFRKSFLASKSGQVAREYLKTREISDFSAELFQIGFAPDSFHFLSEFLRKKGYADQEIVRAGLAASKDRGGTYDRFRDRLIFPIFDLHGTVVGYGGRILEKDDNAPKYLNSPETEIYNKSRLLYGLNFAKQAIREQDFVILVEGYTDVIASHQAGVTNVVASSGTALTKEQIALIKRFTQNLYLCFDMDMAGQNATKRGVDLAIEEGLDVKIITLDNGKDPDELVKEDKEAWLVAIKEAKPLLDHYFAKTFADFDASKLEDKKKAAAALMPLLAKIQNEVEREHYLQKLAGKISTDERVLSEALKNKYLSKKTQPVRLNQRFGQSQKDDQSSSRPSKDIIEEVAERIIGILIKFPQAVKEFESQENLIENLSSEKAQLVKKVISLYNTKANNKWFDSEKLIKHLDQEDSSLALLSKQLLLKLEGDYPSIVAGSFNDEAKIELENGFRRLKKYQLQKRLAEIASSMKEAEEQGHQDKISNLSQEFGELTTKLMQF